MSRETIRMKIWINSFLLYGTTESFPVVTDHCLQHAPPAMWLPSFPSLMTKAFLQASSSAESSFHLCTLLSSKSSFTNIGPKNIHKILFFPLFYSPLSNLFPVLLHKAQLQPSLQPSKLLSLARCARCVLLRPLSYFISYHIITGPQYYKPPPSILLCVACYILYYVYN